MKVHFIGIGGIGVSALAQYYLQKDHKVSGSDLVSSEITDALKKLGAKIFIGKHKQKNLPKEVDFVIYSPAVPEDNPELKKAHQLQTTNHELQVLSYPEALGELTKQHFTIAICGTHGKSTTTAMTALILIKAGLNPTVIVGTKLREFGDSNFRMGSQESKVPPRRGKARSMKLSGKSQKSILVIEADEHFASFLNYWPKIIVLTALEPDHLDYYENFENYVLAFKKFISHLPKDGVLIANKDDRNILRMLKSKVKSQKSKVIFYSLKQKEAKKLKKILKVPGEHNVQNALAALATAQTLKIPDKISFEALSKYKGTWRRFEISHTTYNTKPITIVSDYAHHPTKVRVTLKAAREKFPNKKIWLVYQPHQYQRTFYLFKDFVKVFNKALQKGETGSPLIDRLIITDIYDVAGREKKEIKKKVSSEKLIANIKYKVSSTKKRGDIIYIPTIEEAAEYLKKNLQGGRLKGSEPRPGGAGEVVIIMGAGDIYKLCDLF